MMPESSMREEDQFPSVAVVVPALDVEEHIDQCLAAIENQTYGHIVETLVIDGGSTDLTRAKAEAFEGVTVVANPARTRPSAMNVALSVTKAAVVVRVDARTVIDPDYVDRCVQALAATSATIVGGPMRLRGTSALERGIAAAMSSRLGGGPAAFRRSGGSPRFVDTVYLGSFYRDDIVELGGYDEQFGGNEDAELAHRARLANGVFLDPSIRSTYAVRGGFKALASQYRRYGKARAGTIIKHPTSLAPRQLAVPALFVALASPWRKGALRTYLTVVISRAIYEAIDDSAAAPFVAGALPVMHLSWGIGFLETIYRHIRLKR